jgi:hypothetical protein
LVVIREKCWTCHLREFQASFDVGGMTRDAGGVDSAAFDRRSLGEVVTV